MLHTTVNCAEHIMSLVLNVVTCMDEGLMVMMR